METLVFENPTAADIERAGEIIRNGGLVAFPTETVYGLGGNGLDAEAAAKIYAAKGRPSDNPLIIHLADAGEAEQYAHTTPEFFKLAERFMPGPLTVIMKKRDRVPATVTGGLETVAVRVPSHPTANALIRAAGVPIAAPSANLSGKPSPTRLSHVMRDMYGRTDAIIGGGETDIGVESTIVTLAGDRPCVLRPGFVTPEELREILPDLTVSEAVTGKYEGAALSPGMRYKHYSPRAAVTLLDGDYAKIAEFLSARPASGKLCFEGDAAILAMPNAVSCGREDDPASQAKLLFARLRDFDDREDITEIFARMPSREGAGLAVFNRLIRAAGFNVKRT